MRIQLVCWLLVMLSAIVLSQDEEIKHFYKKFKNQHINEQMSVNRCDEVMQARNISRVNKHRCKKTNTFIRASINTVRYVCGRAGERIGSMTKSLKPFDIVVCKLKNPRAKYPKCQYRGKAVTRRIIIKCKQGFPVHYDGDIAHCEN